MRMERIDPEENAYRFYEVTLEPDLLDQASVLVKWGRIGRPGRSRVRAGGDYDGMRRLAEKIRQRKLHSGYMPVR